MKIKYILFAICLMALSAAVSWYLTDNYFKNKQVPILTLIPSTSSSYLFDQTTTLCQPNLMNGSCSNAVKASYNLIVSTEMNSCKTNMDKLVSICKNYLGSVPTYSAPPPIQSTECYKQAFTGEVICTTY